MGVIRPSGRDHYVKKYAEDTAIEAEWLAVASKGKVDSIEQLARSISLRPGVIVELGCGPGEVIGECARRGLADTYIGVDYSADAVAFARTRWPGVRFEQFDLTRDPVPWASPVDLVVLSHVVEHLEQPEGILQKLVTQARYAVIEVPLEDLAATRIKNQFRDRANNAAGHVAWYTPESFRQLLESCGLEVLGQRTYFPRIRLKDIWTLPKRSLSWRLKVTATGNLLPLLFGPLWTRYYMGNHAVIVKPR